MSDDEDRGNNNASHPDNTKMVHEGWSSLTEKKRGCTDILALLVLIAVWVALTFIGFVVTGVIQDDSLSKGNPVRLTNALDYNGDICGFTKSVKSKPYAYYLPSMAAVCVKSCPSSTNFESFICEYESQSRANNTMTGYELVAQQKCMYQLQTKNYLNRCLPDVNVDEAATGASAVASSTGVTIDSALITYKSASDKGTSWFNEFLADVYSLMGYIFGFGIGISVALAFGYLYFLRIPGLLFTFLWTMILGVFILLLVGSWLLWSLSNEWDTDDLHTNSEVMAMRFFAYFGMAVTVLYFCLIFVLRKRVNLAIGVVKQAARALAAMPTILALPIIQAVGLVCFLVPWIIYMLYLASSGDMKTYTATIEYGGESYTTTQREFQYTTNTKYTFLYLLFCWFWTSEFIIALGQLIIALAFAAWYFCRDKSQIGQSTVVWSLKTAIFYHSGSAAFGSLIIAIIKTIRAVIAYIQKKAKKSKNKVLEYIMCILQCLMWCLEKIMKFINKHAYIITAIYGNSFCSASRKAFFLLLRNILRVAAVNMVASFILFLGKLFVPLCTTFLCYLAIAYGTNNDNINGIIGPLVFTFLLAYWVTAMFIEIFGMGIETILFCFIADEEMFKVEDRFAEAELMSTIQKTAQIAAAQKGKVGVEPDPVGKGQGDNYQVAVKATPPGEAVF